MYVCEGIQQEFFHLLCYLSAYNHLVEEVRWAKSVERR